jgi:hypothetical protein
MDNAMLHKRHESTDGLRPRDVARLFLLRFHHTQGIFDFQEGGVNPGAWNKEKCRLSAA